MRIINEKQLIKGNNINTSIGNSTRTCTIVDIVSDDYSKYVILQPIGNGEYVIQKLVKQDYEFGQWGVKLYNSPDDEYALESVNDQRIVDSILKKYHEHMNISTDTIACEITEICGEENRENKVDNPNDAGKVKKSEKKVINTSYNSVDNNPKPYKGNGKYIFISYSHMDKAQVFKIISMLQTAGYNVWFDEGIDPGTEWDVNIANHIVNCAYFIGMISRNSINSSNCKDELSYARDLDKGRCMVFLEDTKLDPGLQMRLNRIQAIHKYKYRDETDFYEKLFSAHGISSCLK